MSSEFYLPRTLKSETSSYSESDLLTASNFIIVLAEPGGGKTRLLESLADQLQSKPVTANALLHKAPNASHTPIVVDAFDELAKVDSSGIHKLLGKISDTKPSLVVLSSRSSEWDNAYTMSVRDFFDSVPLVVRMEPFSDDEQQQLFAYHAPTEDFKAFQHQVARFDIQPLLPNPQFLQLFANAYIESGRQFKDKSSIFVLAIERLAKESNTSVSTKGDIPFEKKIELAEEVFAKLLLSGSEGVSANDVSSERIYPRLESLISSETQAASILATRLFKPGEKSDQHMPVHKIVSEYCAARFLIKRLTSQPNQLSISQCFSIIAPNSTVRDELRGLLGWMAALGNKAIQEAAIALAPYSVLANGDPSQLLPSSKRKLLQKLQEVAKEDPYFRRSDQWRTFSVASFFTEEVVEKIKPLLIQKNEHTHLRGLLLELLIDSKASPFLANELQQLTRSPETSEDARVLANQCLLKITDHDHRTDLDAFITEASKTSLKLAAESISKLGSRNFEKPYIAKFLRKCANLYPDHQHQFEGTIGARYFIKRFISNLDFDSIQWLLDDLTRNLACICGKASYECDCRNGISKIVGSLLDHLFKLSSTPFEPSKVWQWVRNLNFHNSINADQSLAVHTLQRDDVLRQGIIRHALEKVTNDDQIHEIMWSQFDWRSHTGLRFQANDYQFVVDLAFDIDNTALWSYFTPRHQYHHNESERGPNPLRRHMRLQARKKPAFLKAWARKNRSEKEFERRHRRMRFSPSRRVKKHQLKQDKIRAANLKYFQGNRELVETGKHWGYLEQFAYLTLEKPDKIEQEFADIALVKNALCNCLDFIESHVPNLQELAELQCESKARYSEMILYAACLEILRSKGSLHNIKHVYLSALRTGLNVHYHAVTNDEREVLKAELDKLLFPNLKAAEEYLRAYIEPQLNIQGCSHPQVEWLRYDDTFKPLSPLLPLEWLTRFPDISVSTTSELFELAAQFGDREALSTLIAERCKEFISTGSKKTDGKEWKEKRSFWFLRAFYFLPETSDSYSKWLKEDKDNIHLFYGRTGRIISKDHTYWPPLTSTKIEFILDAFIREWPSVELPGQWGSESPKGEKAYRFLNDVIWYIEKDAADASIPVLDRLLHDQKYKDFHPDLRSIRASQIRKKALSDFQAPEPSKIVKLLDQGEIATVEGLRALLLEELQIYQADLEGSETTSKDVFYQDPEQGKRLGEVDATLRIADRMRLRLESKGITVTPEHQLKDANRCDFTCTKILGTQRKLLVTEVKGQWHRELYSAASKQLHERYAIHPDAEQQGIYLVIWYGEHEKVADRKTHGIKSPLELKKKIEDEIPLAIKGLVDVFVLDVSTD